MAESLHLWLYQIENIADAIVNGQLQHLSPFSIGFIFLAGLATSLTPCTLSMLPLTVSYIGGFESHSTLKSAVQSLWFSLGFATTLTALGLVAALFGRIYGQTSNGVSIILGVVAIAMGLYLLEVLRLPLPNLSIEVSKDLPRGLRSYLVGLTFGLAASPCSTPVLITLLTYISTTTNVVLGAVLLLAYATGSVLPLMVAGTFTGAIKQILVIRQWSGGLTWISGIILVGFGTISILSRIA